MSVNIGPVINNNVICELSDSDHSLHPEDLKVREGFAFFNMEVSKWNFVSNVQIVTLLKRGNLSQRSEKPVVRDSLKVGKLQGSKQIGEGPVYKQVG